MAFPMLGNTGDHILGAIRERVENRVRKGMKNFTSCLGQLAFTLAVT